MRTSLLQFVLLLAARAGLRMAQSQDPGVPLFHCREGLAALELRPDWSPAHLGLAELARREGRGRAAQHHRDQELAILRGQLVEAALWGDLNRS